MNFVEQQALEKINARYNLKNVIYKRYLDDSIIGPLEMNESMFQFVKDTFNSIDKNIKFTLEVPRMKLNFLDLTIWTENNKIMFQKYTKELASGNTLKKDSWLPNSIKTNFVKQKIMNVHERCSATLTTDARVEAEKSCLKNLKSNGYNDTDLVKAKISILNSTKKKKNDNANKAILKLPFISDSLNRKINYFIRKYKLNVRYVNTGNKRMRTVLKKNSQMKKHDDCEICKKLPNNYSCEKSCVVYQFTCTKCNSKYIGKTARPFYIRYKEHSSSLKNKNCNSALSDHSKICDVESMDDFSIEYLRCLHNPMDTNGYNHEYMSRVSGNRGFTNVIIPVDVASNEGYEPKALGEFYIYFYLQ